MKPQNTRIARALELAKDVFILGEAQVISLEGFPYERISGTNRSIRFDKGDPAKNTKHHAHIFAQQNGKGGELFSVNCDGTGHDGSKGKAVPKKVAEFLRKRDYKIADNLALESIDLEAVELGGWEIVIVAEADTPAKPNRPAYLDW